MFGLRCIYWWCCSELIYLICKPVSCKSRVIPCLYSYHHDCFMKNSNSEKPRWQCKIRLETISCTAPTKLKVVITAPLLYSPSPHPQTPTSLVHQEWCNDTLIHRIRHFTISVVTGNAILVPWLISLELSWWSGVYGRVRPFQPQQWPSGYMTYCRTQLCSIA